ncbi:hypothetical protein K2173_021889 [Erythroxylum novogranatense]|uniref:Uncharacterized protein n=1 Tax=Erythroxylum novogranatense TaxID=1862640 RepID=A0AAV8T267_9ROSI|nr:hypothetical protein K2173_021889 [Erythroxylum novogranatense]
MTKLRIKDAMKSRKVAYIKWLVLLEKFLYGELVERAKEKEEKEAKSAIEEDSLRREIFEEYIAHLQEKAKEKERKREEKKPLMLIVPDVKDVYTPLHIDVIVPLFDVVSTLNYS